jgi:hypothetical protein
MKAISVRQPWAALIALGVKDIENRAWRTSHRGPILVHASLGRSGRTLGDIEREYGVAITPELTRLCEFVGGIVGGVNVVDCVKASSSLWFDPVGSNGKSNYGFVLREARLLRFQRSAGRLGLFEMSYEEMASI